MPSIPSRRRGNPIMLRVFALLLLALFLGGCATVPEALRGDFPATPNPVQVRAQATAFIGQKVRWGGIVLRVDNHHDSTTLEILAFPLNDDARPETDSANLGRFLLNMPGFVEPNSYEPKREVTIIGRVKSVEVHKIGEYNYHYPVVDGSVLHLWPKRPVYRPNDYDDPWYPWGPWGPYPWRTPYPYYR